MHSLVASRPMVDRRAETDQDKGSTGRVGRMLIAAFDRMADRAFERRERAAQVDSDFRAIKEIAGASTDRDATARASIEPSLCRY